MRLSLAYFDRRQSSQFIGRLNNDVEAMRLFLTDGIIRLGSEMLRIGVIIVVMAQLDWQLTFISLTPLPLLVVISMKSWPIIRKRWYRQWRSIFRLSVRIGNTLQGIRVVKAFGQERSEINRYQEANNEVISQSIRTEGFWQGMFPAFSFIAGFGTILLWLKGGQLVLNNQLQLGVLIALISYFGMLIGPLQWLSQMLNSTGSALAAADRIFEIIDTTSEVPDAVVTKHIGQINGDIHFKKVTFGYDKNHPVLKEIDLYIKAGEMIGLVGHSGAGKTTLVNLLCRFYDPDIGVVKIDPESVNILIVLK